ncbi:hypothetical protein M409DRAFT_19102 [Zasmidium cellare ATCC 36951]|uniref:Uncharacterized protein n=1 Tax=Zasmidium cellare ATCC 36951 TaxID=1080233 RepID=A0A6A6CZ22_ZASCE|nr:uncharacterized protein M409DRAFT_19102 [Zasmidium cellare ATCC 36951]KAF2171132.1 hypothetical protein M409DRAFT_19102 [Zasmidium cellare ATCC 36951]
MDNSPLNKLSAELRNQIYELALTSDNPVSISDGSAVQPPLTRTCKQIRSESLLLSYGLNSITAIISAPTRDPNSDNLFHTSVDRIVVWAKSTPTECHHAVTSLKFSLATGRDWIFNRLNWDRRSSALRELRGELKCQGYEKDRVLVLGEKACEILIADRGHVLRTKLWDQTNAIKAFFEDVGFKYEVDE